MKKKFVPFGMVLYILWKKKILQSFERPITQGKKLKVTAHVNQMKQFSLPIDKQYKDASPML